jgi:phage anti-repressor protein
MAMFPPVNKSFDKRQKIVKLMQNSTDKKRPITKEMNMFSVSEKASEMIKEFLKNRSEAPSIRVLMQEGG